MLTLNIPVGPIPRGAGAPAAVAAVILSPSTLSVAAGSTATISATPKNAAGIALTGRVVTWASSDTSKATVNSSGVVTGVAAGSATITATCEGVSATCAATVTAAVSASPPPASGTTLTTLSAINNDGLTGTRTAIGLATFAPGAVQPADVAALAVLSGGTEIGAYVNDEGARHKDGSVRWVRVSLPATHTDPNVAPTFAVVKGVRAVARLAAPTYAALVMTDNVPTTGISADAKSLRLTNTVVVHHYDRDTIYRVAPQDIPYSFVYNDFGQGSAVVPQHATLHNYIDLSVRAKPDGTLLAFMVGASTADGTNGHPADAQWNTVAIGEPLNLKDLSNWSAYQAMAGVRIWLKPGTGSFTLGTTLLTDSMVAMVTVDGATLAPWYSLPNNLPRVSLASVDVANNVAANLLPWKVAASSAIVAAGGVYASNDAADLYTVDQLYRWQGAPAYVVTNGGYTTYAPSMLLTTQFVQRGTVRHFRRALAAYDFWHKYASTNDTAAQWGTPEPAGDTSMALWHWVLTGDPTAKTRANDVALGQERAQYVSYYPDGIPATDVATLYDLDKPGSLRWGMHVAQAAVLLDQHGLGSLPGYTITAGSEQNGRTWSINHASASTQAARFARWASFLPLCVQPTTGTNATYNPGMSRIWQAADTSEGNHGGNKPFMFGFVALWTCVGMDWFGVDGGCRDAIYHTYDYLFNAKKLNGTNVSLMIDRTAGHENFVYCESYAVDGGNSASSSTEVNGQHLLPLEWLRRNDTARATTYTAWGDLLNAALANTDAEARRYHGKTASESALGVSAWNAARLGL